MPSVARRALAVLAALGVLLWIAPWPGSWFRAEDLVAFDHYSDVPWWSCFTDSHLHLRMVTFFRPLGDLLTWLLVRGVGPNADVMHGLLWGLHVGVAGLVVAAARSLFQMDRATSWIAGGIAVAHPFSPAVTRYLDGGVAQLALAACTAGACLALSRWRRGEGSAVTLGLTTFAGMLCFDGGLVLPAVLIALGVVAPGVVQRRVPWWLVLAWPVVLGGRKLATGVWLGGYGGLEWGAVLKGAPAVLRDLMLPVFGDWNDAAIGLTDLHSATAEMGFAVAALAAVVGALASWRVSTSWSDEARRWVAGVVLTMGLAAPGALELASNVGHGHPFAPSLAYRLYPAAMASALVWAAVCAGWRTWQPALGTVWGALCIVSWLGLGSPWRTHLADAGRLASGAVAAVHERSADGEPVVVFGVPGGRVVGPRDMGRVLNFGLSSACRPPLSDHRVEVLPIFASPGYGDAVVDDAVIARLGERRDWRALQWAHDPDGGLGLPKPIDLPVPEPADLVLHHVDGVGEEDVVVDEDGGFRLGIVGETTGLLKLVLINPLHPFFAMHNPPARLTLMRGPPGPQRGLLYAAALQFLEVARRHPGERSYAVLEELLPDGAVRTSQVLTLRLWPPIQGEAADGAPAEDD